MLMENKTLKFVIPLAPVTKKNSQQIYINRATGKPFVSQSKQYKEYEQKAILCLRYNGEPIDYPVNVSSIFFMKTKRKVDLVNCQEALLDILVLAKILEDDNSQIVVSMDGSRVEYDKTNPRTEVVITCLSK